VDDRGSSQPPPPLADQRNYENGGSGGGPMGSLEFAPSGTAERNRYALLLVDSARGEVSAYDAASPADLRNFRRVLS